MNSGWLINNEWELSFQNFLDTTSPELSFGMIGGTFVVSAAGWSMSTPTEITISNGAEKLFGYVQDRPDGIQTLTGIKLEVGGNLLIAGSVVDKQEIVIGDVDLTPPNITTPAMNEDYLFVLWDPHVGGQRVGYKWAQGGGNRLFKVSFTSDPNFYNPYNASNVPGAKFRLYANFQHFLIDNMGVVKELKQLDNQVKANTRAIDSLVSDQAALYISR